jgi:hypothetical protein
MFWNMSSGRLQVSRPCTNDALTGRSGSDNRGKPEHRRNQMHRSAYYQSRDNILHFPAFRHPCAGSLSVSISFSASDGKKMATGRMRCFEMVRCRIQISQPSTFFGSSSPMNQSSTRWRAHGVLRRNVRLDLTVGLNWKQRTGMRRPISPHPCRWTSWLRICSSVTPCNGSRGWETGDVMSKLYFQSATDWRMISSSSALESPLPTRCERQKFNALTVREIFKRNENVVWFHVPPVC